MNASDTAYKLYSYQNELGASGTYSLQTPTNLQKQALSAPMLSSIWAFKHARYEIERAAKGPEVNMLAGS